MKITKDIFAIESLIIQSWSIMNILNPWKQNKTVLSNDFALTFSTFNKTLMSSSVYPVFTGLLATCPSLWMPWFLHNKRLFYSFYFNSDSACKVIRFCSVVLRKSIGTFLLELCLQMICWIMDCLFLPKITVPFSSSLSDLRGKVFRGGRY